MRSELDVEIDREWHVAAHSEDQKCAALHWQRHNALVAERASGLGGLTRPDAALAPIGGIGVGAQLAEG